MILALLSVLTKTQLKVACKKQSDVLVEVTGRLRHSWNKESNDVRLLSSQLLLGSLPILSTMAASCSSLTFYSLNISVVEAAISLPSTLITSNFIWGINVPQ